MKRLQLNNQRISRIGKQGVALAIASRDRGANLLVIGRPITATANIAEASEAIANSLRN